MKIVIHVAKNAADYILCTPTNDDVLSHATSVGNIRKQIEDRKPFFISNIVSIVSSASNKVDQNEVHAIKYLIQCSISNHFVNKQGFYKT